MNHSFDFRQGLSEGLHMFEGAVIDAKGAMVIVGNIEATMRHRPPGHAAGMAEAVRRVREAIGQGVTP